MDRLSEIRARCEAFEDSNDSYKGVRPQYILPVLADDGYPHSWAEIAAHSHEDISYLLSRLEKAEAERDAVIEDFQDFATSGIYNMNPYCGNRCAECTDGRGWCIENYCKGFKVAIEPPKGE